MSYYRHFCMGLIREDGTPMPAFRQFADFTPDFSVTVTFCFTPESRGLAPHYTSPPIANEEFAEFCADMIPRYAAPPQGLGRRHLAAGV